MNGDAKRLAQVSKASEALLFFVTHLIEKYLNKTITINHMRLEKSMLSWPHQKCGRCYLKILVTGALGLVGRALCPLLEDCGHEVIKLDVKFEKTHPFYGDLRDEDRLSQMLFTCDGVIHMAGVSRVIWGYEEPNKCWQLNVDGTKNVIAAALNTPKKPWILFTSSREVYGQQSNLPVEESEAQLTPKNIYAESKLAAEELLLDARQTGLVTGIVRLSSVYGDTKDHPTRVIPAFTRAVISGRNLCIEGKANVCDFTYVGDVTNAIKRFTEILQAGEMLPPLHLASGVGTTLVKLAELAISAHPATQSCIVYKSPRTYDVEKFIGSPVLSDKLLGWKANVNIEEGVKIMVSKYKELLQIPCEF